MSKGAQADQVKPGPTRLRDLLAAWSPRRGGTPPQAGELAQALTQARAWAQSLAPAPGQPPSAPWLEAVELAAGLARLGPAWARRGEPDLLCPREES